MTRETKSKSDAEAIILERLRAMPGGEAVEVVYIVLDEEDDEGPSSHFGMCWTGSGDMREIFREAMQLHGQLRREFRLVDE